jgi:hypothetical protein
VSSSVESISSKGNGLTFGGLMVLAEHAHFLGQHQIPEITGHFGVLF